jgi:hypothetical protein
LGNKEGSDFEMKKIDMKNGEDKFSILIPELSNAKSYFSDLIPKYLKIIYEENRETKHQYRNAVDVCDSAIIGIINGCKLFLENQSKINSHFAYAHKTRDFDIWLFNTYIVGEKNKKIEVLSDENRILKSKNLELEQIENVSRFDYNVDIEKFDSFYRERRSREHKPWNNEELDNLKRLWYDEKLNINKIAKIMNRTPFAIEMRINLIEDNKKKGDLK